MCVIPVNKTRNTVSDMRRMYQFDQSTSMGPTKVVQVVLMLLYVLVFSIDKAQSCPFIVTEYI